MLSFIPVFLNFQTLDVFCSDVLLPELTHGLRTCPHAVSSVDYLSGVSETFLFCLEFTFTFKTLLHFRTSLVVQWFRLHLPMQGVQVWSLVGKLGSYMPPGQKTKTWNRSYIVTNSVKDLKMVHIKEKRNLKSTPLCFPQWVRWAVGCPGSLRVSRGHCACQGYAHCPGPVHVAHTVLLVLTLFEKMLSGSRLEFLGPLFHAFCSFPLPGSMCLRMIFLGNSWLIVFLLSYFFPVTGNADFFFFFSIWADGILLPKMKWVWGDSQKWNVNHYILLKYLE